MKRATHEAWMRERGVAPDAWRPVLFEAPALRWVRDAPYSRGNRPLGDAELLAALRELVGELVRDIRHHRDARPDVRAALGWARRAWLAHCAGRDELRAELLAEAGAARTRAVSAPLLEVAAQAMLAQQRRSITGRAQYGGAPERRAREVRDACRTNPGKSNREIAVLVGVSEKTVRRHRPNS